jgi:N-acetylglucosaminyl-diphospho-decaprenol L-rhamnosyltransferase
LEVVEAKRGQGGEPQRVIPADVSVIVVNWNSLSYLSECLTSIYQYTEGVSFEVIVVDNASPEGGVDVLEEKFPQIKVIKSDKNLGFAGANNLGFRYSTGAYILFLNPDTRLAGRAINVLLEQAKSLSDAGVVGGKLLNTDLSVQTASVQKFPTLLNQLTNIEYLRTRWPGCPLWDISPLFRDTEGAVKVDVIPGACMMLKREVFERAGLFTEDYFMYAEDIDLNYKVRLLGLSSYYVGAARVVHHGGTSSSRQPVSHWSVLMKHRAMLKYYRKIGGPAYSALYQITMGISAVLHLVLLGAAFPFGDQQSVRVKSAKWKTVLRWSLGLERPTVNA